LFAALSASAHAQDAYPNRPIRLLIGFPPGAGMDAVARPFAARMSELIGQPVIVENRPGAAGTVSTAAVARAPADGYTLGFGANGDLAIAPHLMKLEYNPLTGFSAISLVSREHGFILLAHPSFPARTVRELVEVARLRPGSVNYGSPGVGVPHHIAMEHFKKAAEINIVHIPFKGGGPLVSDLVGGQLLLGIGNVTAAPLIAAGKLKAIAVTAPRRIAALPDVPTFAEAGYPGVDAGGWFALIGPPNLPPAVIEALNKASRAVAGEAAFKDRLLAIGMTPEATSPAEASAILRDDYRKWGTLIRDTGIRVD
jgi:tripartite-type tricarboxylate transporter receptor subunit TctC